MKRSEIFPSRFLKSIDLGGKPVDVEIERAVYETIGKGEDQQQKLVVHFKGGKLKPLVCNVTNFDSIAEIAGGDTDAWPGYRVQLYPTRTAMKGVIVDCIRIRPPQ